MNHNENASLVTVILTTLNSERFLARSIASCLDQTYQNLELLIVDGGSQDRTLEIVAGYQDPRIRLIHQEDNVGKLPGALNLGMVHAKGEFITWTQDDCWYGPNAIQIMVEYLELHSEVAFVYTDYWSVDEAGDRVRYQPAGRPERIAAGGDIIGVCFLFRRQVYEIIGPQDPRYFPVHEVPWHIRVASQFRICPLHRALMSYTLNSESLTGRIGAWKLNHMTAAVLFQEGYLDAKAYRRRLAKIYVDQAFDDFVLQGAYPAFWRHTLAGIRHDMDVLRNRGLLKMMAVSLLPVRAWYRRRMFAAWQADTTAEQARLSTRDAQTAATAARDGSSDEPEMIVLSGGGATN